MPYSTNSTHITKIIIYGDFGNGNILLKIIFVNYQKLRRVKSVFKIMNYNTFINMRWAGNALKTQSYK